MEINIYFGFQFKRNKTRKKKILCLMQINRKRKLELDNLMQTREIFFEFSK